MITIYNQVLSDEIHLSKHRLQYDASIRLLQNVNTLDPRYNTVIGRRALYHVITRTALYRNEQQKMLVSPSCHIIISLSTDISVHL